MIVMNTQKLDHVATAMDRVGFAITGDLQQDHIQMRSKALRGQSDIQLRLATAAGSKDALVHCIRFSRHSEKQHNSKQRQLLASTNDITNDEKSGNEQTDAH
jgi:hypothetical protein